MTSCIVCKKNINNNYKFHLALCFNYYKLEKHKDLYYKLYNTPKQKYVEQLNKENQLKKLKDIINKINNDIINIKNNKSKYIDDVQTNKAIEYKKNTNKRKENTRNSNLAHKTNNTLVKYEDDHELQRKYKMLEQMKIILYQQSQLIKKYIQQKKLMRNNIYSSSLASTSTSTSTSRLHNYYNSYKSNKILYSSSTSSYNNFNKNNTRLYNPRKQLRLGYQQQYIHDYEMLLKGRSVIIVGPSKTVLRKRNADFIHSFDLVVRLNKSLPIAMNMEEFIGYRTDILYNSCYSDSGQNNISVNLLKNNNVKYLRASYPPISVFKQDIERFKLHNRSYGFPFGHIDTKYYKSIVQKINTRPYTGTVAILDILKYDIKVLYITGLDFFKYNYHSSYGVRSRDEMKAVRNGPIHKREPQIDLLRQLFLTDKRIKVDDILESILLEKYINFYNRIIVQFQSYFNYIFSSVTTNINIDKKTHIYLYGSQSSYSISSFINDNKENNGLIICLSTNSSYLEYKSNQDRKKNTDLEVIKISYSEIPINLIKNIKKYFGHRVSEDCILMSIVSTMFQYYLQRNQIMNNRERSYIYTEGIDLYGKNKNSKKMEEFLYYKYLCHKNIIKY